MRLKKAIQQIQKEEGMERRIEALERRLSDEDLSSLINMRVDIKVRDKLDQVMLENDSGMTKLRNDLESMRNLNRKTEQELQGL